MKQVSHRNSTSKVLGLCLAVLLAFSTSVFAQGDPVAGKKLFGANCAACHKLDKDMTGPALRKVEQRLSDDQGLDKAWIQNWIRNSSKMIKSGDAYAVKVYNEWAKTDMTAFPSLTDADIDNILAYTAQDKPEPAPTSVVADGGGSSSQGGASDMVLGVLVLVLLVLVAMLFMVTKTLKSLAAKNGLDVDAVKRKPIWKAFAENQFAVLVAVIVFMLGAAYYAYGYLSQVGVDQGYQPVQPIHFSHKIHAGDNKIDCKYCHSSARVSKTSGIPALNVCMNCHKNISEYTGETTAEYSKDFYDKQIQKLYDAVGWDGRAYTGEQKPVKWVRVHNLPDFAYFNHSQHVSVAGVECQTCHGPVETMEVLEQFSPLTMGWCINCHRETDVKMEGNEYYTKIHEELSKKYGVDKLTAAQMGGLECGKCHY